MAFLPWLYIYGVTRPARFLPYLWRSEIPFADKRRVIRYAGHNFGKIDSNRSDENGFWQSRYVCFCDISFRYVKKYFSCTMRTPVNTQMFRFRKWLNLMLDPVNAENDLGVGGVLNPKNFTRYSSHYMCGDRVETNDQTLNSSISQAHRQIDF